MNKRISDLEVTRMLSDLGNEIARIESVSHVVARRVMTASMEPRSKLYWKAAPVALIAISLTTGWQLYQRWQRNGRTATAARSIPSVQAGEVSIAQRLACVIDARSILVCWTYRGGHPRSPADESPRDRDTYVEIPVQSIPLEGGETCRWTLFVARSDTLPLLDPPLLRLVDKDNIEVGFGVSARRYSPADLREAIALSALGPRSGIRLEEVEDLARRYERQVKQ